MRALLVGLSRAVDGFWKPWARAVVVDLGEAQVGEGQPAQPCDRVIGAQAPDATSRRSWRSRGSSISFTILPGCEQSCDISRLLRPRGTFTEERS